MAELTCQIVRPDRLLLEGPIAHVVLVSYTGEVGVWPGHASEILALGDGVMRITRRKEDGGDLRRVVISGGYAELNKMTEMIKFASIIAAAAPMLVIYPFVQKYFEQGFMAGAVKG